MKTMTVSSIGFNVFEVYLLAVMLHKFGHHKMLKILTCYVKQKFKDLFINYLILQCEKSSNYRQIDICLQAKVTFNYHLIKWMDGSLNLL